jgi:exonuclease III
VLIASRTALQERSQALSLPWPESGLWVASDTSEGPLEVVTVHVPNAANGAVKPHTLRAVRDALATAEPVPRVLCGDLNTPRRELPSGEVISFARDTSGRLRADRGAEWDLAELALVPGLRDLGYRDAYRSVHGYARSEPSWTWQRIAGHSGGWRLDHIFTSAELEPLTCVYHHGWRDDGLSDHSALEVEFRRSSSAQRGV